MTKPLYSPDFFRQISEILNRLSKIELTLFNSGITGVSNINPTGTIHAYAGTSLPTGYLVCDGTAVSREDYSELFSCIGTIYGAGDGSTTFNLPNLKGKVLVGLDSSDTDFDSLTDAGGAKTNTHNHWQTVGNDGSFVWVSQTGNSPRTRTATKTRSGISSAASSGATREDSTYDESISIVQPYQVTNYIIKY